MKFRLRDRFFLALVLLLVALTVYSCSKDSSDDQTTQDDGNLDITVVVMKRNVVDKGALVLGGPIKSERYNVTLPANSTVKELKSVVFGFTGLAHFEQKKVVYKGQTMDPSNTLAYYNVTDGSRIHVLTEYVI
ncbi:ubiquitin family protein [Candidatus Woesearchaeota archaeon]|nr:ubiquitin family protein [Candidatus Woesearchaeota archaeon]